MWSFFLVVASHDHAKRRRVVFLSCATVDVDRNTGYCLDDEDLMSGMQHHDLAIPYSLQPGQLVRLISKYDASQEHYGTFTDILFTLTSGDDGIPSSFDLTSGDDILPSLFLHPDARG